ncbi:hypothetical protein M595_0831 [Lyngbya aestuarii BL J]|uniref:Uncharacterized protein n=1 Tax=Lyngbya aestuarii BL J TaxID=1348334 RepID=U7QPP9_9CYAN|nr:hypothetical protein M595_0831 [Lyngbya aestuarii BL J]
MPIREFNDLSVNSSRYFYSFLPLNEKDLTQISPIKAQL